MTTPPVPPTTEMERLLAELSATQEALTDCTDRTEQTRALCRAQITLWRSEGRSWSWIQRQPAARAFYGPLGGS
jgi:hypothetical protein